MRINKTKILLITLLLFSLVLTSCAGMPFSQSTSKNQNREYYTGTQGVIMRFSDLSSPPSRMYYYEGAERDDNGFSIMLDVHNIGSSWTKGALYISGYDPYMIKIDDIDISSVDGWRECFTDFNFFQGGQLDLNLDCGNEKLSVDQGGVEAGSRDLGAFFKKVFGIDISLLDNVGFSVNTGPLGTRLGLSFGDDLDVDVFGAGGKLLALFSDISFVNYNGLNYDGNSAGNEDYPDGLGVLEPDTPNFPGGEMKTVVFNGEIRNWPAGLDRIDKPINFLVTNCYVYSTMATPQVCIDPSPYDQGVKVCQPRAINLNGGNGAPIVVSSIEQENTKRKIYFDINIRNAGSGTVFDLDYMQYCSPYYPGRLTSQQINNVYIIDARIANQHLKCTPDRGDGIHLINGQGHVRCEYDMQYITAKSAYETPLIIELGYGYSQTMQRSMTIKRVS